ncbi:MAG: family 78 glycoside hydrolase catalytic domain [Clostridia bacterium]|nr:family 78 glycoside hydrolase catalytic domain [Clostridia bacterium]
MIIKAAKWISAYDCECPLFEKSFVLSGKVKKATLHATSAGVYEATINGRRVSDFVLAPAWTDYRTRLQVQKYDVTDMLEEKNLISILLGTGWFYSRVSHPRSKNIDMKPAVLASLEIEYDDGVKQLINTNDTWTWRESPVIASDIYDGEEYDANRLGDPKKVNIADNDYGRLIEQEGEDIVENEYLYPVSMFKTPKGETVVDFGQEITGYVEISINAKKGDRIVLSHAEVLDKDGNFYTENYRSAKAILTYTCKDGFQTYKPHLTFYGFRYIRIDEAPEGICADNFAAIAVHSRLRRTAWLSSASPMLNRLFENIIWGQKGNFLDVPTDCPQRDEREGWTGDAQVFVKTATYQYDVNKFFKKWLHDLKSEQAEDGRVPIVIPNAWESPNCSAAWGDAAVICPWQVYETYGDKSILEDQFSSMKAWVDYIGKKTLKENLWITDDSDEQKCIHHFADWLGLDAPYGSYKGSTDENLIASAFYAYDTALLIKAGKVLDKDMSEYEEKYEKIVSAFKAEFPQPKTQTECVLMLHFDLTDDKKAVAKKLAELVNEYGHLTTGFVGTPYLLHALSDNGYSDIAWQLLLKEDYPSWLYPITKGATTIWEHWDGIKPDGSFWSKDMNSYNHYSYGAVLDWVIEKAAGIRPIKAGFEKISISPIPNEKLGSLCVRFDSPCGTIESKWIYENGICRYTITTPAETEITVNGKTYNVKPGTYMF